MLRKILTAGIKGQSETTMCCPGDNGYPLRQEIEELLGDTAMPTPYPTFVASIVKPGRQIMDEMTLHKAELIHMAAGVAGEAGELLDAIKKHVFYNKPLDLENVIEELGDLEFYMEGIRALIGVQRGQVLDRNVAKLSARYPNGKFSNEDAQARADKS